MDTHTLKNPDFDAAVQRQHAFEIVDKDDADNLQLVTLMNFKEEMTMGLLPKTLRRRHGHDQVVSTTTTMTWSQIMDKYQIMDKKPTSWTNSMNGSRQRTGSRCDLDYVLELKPFAKFH